MLSSLHPVAAANTDPTAVIPKELRQVVYLSHQRFLESSDDDVITQQILRNTQPPRAPRLLPPTAPKNVCCARGLPKAEIDSDTVIWSGCEPYQSLYVTICRLVELVGMFCESDVRGQLRTVKEEEDDVKREDPN